MVTQVQGLEHPEQSAVATLPMEVFSSARNSLGSSCSVALRKIALLGNHTIVENENMYLPESLSSLCFRFEGAEKTVHDH